MGLSSRQGCLTDETLAHLLDGSADGDDLARITSHIDACDACRHVVAEAGRAVSARPEASAGREAEDDVLPRGARIGRYEVVQAIGAGAMGVVYRARDPELDRDVALKVMKSDAGEPSGGGGPRMLREAKAMARLSHPNVLAIHDVGAVGDDVFLAMELVEGGTLHEWLRGRRRSWREIVEVLCAAGEGLAAAHRAGLVHRDFKPDNVLVSTDGRVRVSDFGLARASEAVPGPEESREPEAEARARPLVRSSTFAGTPAYMAPEQLSRRRADVRSDVFAFSVTFYEALHGERPFDGLDRTHVRPAPKGARVPAWLRRIVLRGLQEKPEDRPESMRALLDAIVRGRSFARLRVALSATAVAFAGAALVIALVGRSRSAAVAASSASSHATTVVDAPLPVSGSAEALQAYESGLHGLRDGKGSASSDFARAAELDPGLAAAHLRCALLEFQVHPIPAREHLAKAVDGRHALDDRDDLLLAAAQAWAQREPPDEAAFMRAMDAAVARYPLDGELAFWAALAHHLAGERAATLSLIDRALRIDPGFTAAYDLRVEELVFADDEQEARAAIGDCVAKASNPMGCLLWQNNLDMADGNAARVAETSRQLLARDPTYYPLYWYEACAAYALGRPTEVVAAFFRQYVADAPTELRAGFELLTASAPDVLGGNFVAADARARELEGRIESVSDARFHAAAAQQRVDLAEETDRAGDAARIAAAFLRRREAWVVEQRADDLALSRDPTPQLLLAEKRAGLVSAEDFEDKRREWVAQWIARLPKNLHPLVWLQGYAAVAETQEEAARAISEQPRYGTVPHHTSYAFAEAELGTLYLRAGRPSEAVPLLERATRSARAAELPFAHTRAHLALGQALAAQGRNDEACAALAVVLARWGRAIPRSVTADQARALARNLRCPGLP